MESYAITYVYEGKTYQVNVTHTKGQEDQFLKRVLDRIESITHAGGLIKDIWEEGECNA